MRTTAKRTVASCVAAGWRRAGEDCHYCVRCRPQDHSAVDMRPEIRQLEACLPGGGNCLLLVGGRSACGCAGANLM